VELRDHPVSAALLVAAAAAATLFRVVPLACDGDRLALAGGGVLRLAEGASCAAVVPGRPVAIALDDDGRATPQQLVAQTRPASEVPRSAYVLAPAASADVDENQLVDATIEVTVPPRTPPTDDIYISTDRSGWSPSEIKMDRLDARHYRLGLKLHRGARVLFRVTRGSYGTMERDAAMALPPAHVLIAAPDTKVSVTVAAWADID
jgi:hypothetical protein